MFRKALICLIALAIVLSASLAHARNWTIATRNGTMRFEADLVEVQGDKVIIQASGKRYQVSFRTLSAADQEFIRSQQGGNAAQAGAGAAPAASTAGASQRSFTLDFQRADSDASLSFEVIATPVPAGVCKRAALSPDGKYAAWVQEQPKHHKKDDPEFGLVLHNIATGESQTLAKAPYFATAPNVRLWGLVFSKDSSILTAVSYDRILRYAIRNNKAEQLSAVAMSSVLENVNASLGSDKDLHKAYALACDGTYLVLGSYYAGICLCKTDDGSVVRSLKGKFCDSDDFWLSGDCRTLVYQIKEDEQLGAMNLVTGKNIENAFAGSWEGVAISPSGKYVVLSDYDLVSVYEFDGDIYPLVTTLQIRDIDYLKHVLVHDDGIIEFPSCVLDIKNSEANYFTTRQSAPLDVSPMGDFMVASSRTSSDPACIYGYPGGQPLYEIPNTEGTQFDWFSESLYDGWFSQISSDGKTVLARPKSKKNASLTILKAGHGGIRFGKAQLPFPEKMDKVFRLDYALDGDRLTVIGGIGQKSPKASLSQYIFHKKNGKATVCKTFLPTLNAGTNYTENFFLSHSPELIGSQDQRAVLLMPERLSKAASNAFDVGLRGYSKIHSSSYDMLWFPESGKSTTDLNVFQWFKDNSKEIRKECVGVTGQPFGEGFLIQQSFVGNSSKTADVKTGIFKPGTKIETTADYPDTLRAASIAVSSNGRWFVALNARGLAKDRPTDGGSLCLIVQDRSRSNSKPLLYNTNAMVTSDIAFFGENEELLRLRSRDKDQSGRSAEVIDLRLGKMKWKQKSDFVIDVAPQYGFYVVAEDWNKLVAKNMEDDQVIANIGMTDSPVTAMTLSHACDRLAVATKDKQMIVYDLSSLVETRQNAPAGETAAP